MEDQVGVLCTDGDIPPYMNELQQRNASSKDKIKILVTYKYAEP
jgi:hypothetical protein